MKTDHMDAIHDLVRELASELDLHYEDNEFFALKESIKALQHGVAVLAQAGHEPPQVYHHVISRFNRQQN